MANRPEAEVDVSEPFVRQLLREQFPAVAELPLAELARGWDNTNYRLGSDLVVRVPHRQIADQLIVNEQQWLAPIADRVELGVPAPLHFGMPSQGFPWHWSIVPYFDGDEAATATLHDPAVTAKKLGTFFAQLHVNAPDDCPVNPYRGCALAVRAESFQLNLKALASRTRAERGDTAIDIDALSAVFDDGCAAHPASTRVWLHGDLHTRNMVVGAGDLVAAIDWGDICAGDRATDLAGAFMLVPDHINVVQAHSGASDADIVRARAWAAHFAVLYLTHSDDEPVMADIGRRLAAALQRRQT